MTTYSNTLKLDSLPSHEVVTGSYLPVIKLDSLPSFEPKGGYIPAIKVIYYEAEEDDRPTSGQIYPRSL